MSRGLIGSIRIRDVLLRGFLAREAQVAHVRAQPPRALLGVGVVRQHARHHVQARAASSLRVAQRRSTTLAANSCSRPGSDASPRSPASQLPGGVLNSTTSSLSDLTRAASSFAWYSYGNANSTARKPACAASREPLEERHFVEEKGEIGGKARHCVRTSCHRRIAPWSRIDRRRPPGIG